SCTRRAESVREDPGRQCPDGTDRGHAPRSESAEHTSRGAAAPVTRAAPPSTTTSSPWKTWHPMMQREFLARFFTLLSSRPVVTCSASSSQTAPIVVTCGRASGRTVDSQYDLTLWSFLRALAQGVGRSLLYLGSSSAPGLCSAMAGSPPTFTYTP